MKGTFHAASRRTGKQTIVHCHWRDCRSESTRLTGATRNLSMIEKRESRIADNSARDEHGPINPKDTLNASVQKPPGPPPISKDWTPNVPRLGPRYTRIGPPMYGDWTTDVQGHRTQHHSRSGPRATWDSVLHGIKDFARFGTSWDSRLREIPDFVGSKTSWDSGLLGIQDFVGSRTLQKKGPLHTSDRNLFLCCSLRKHKLSG